jgi:hypothetical protein
MFITSFVLFRIVPHFLAPVRKFWKTSKLTFIADLLRPRSYCCFIKHLIENKMALETTNKESIIDHCPSQMNSRKGRCNVVVMLRGLISGPTHITVIASSVCRCANFIITNR